MKLYKKISLFISICIAVFIFFISSMSMPPNPLPGFSWVSFAYHFGVFFLLNIFLLLSGKLDKKYIIITLSVCFVYAALDELHQSFVVGRSCTLIDWVTDASGSVFGLVSVFIGKKIFR